MSFSVAEETLEKTIDEVDDIVNPWEVSTTSLKGIDYDKLIRMSLFILIHIFIVVSLRSFWFIKNLA
jgi:hypothetical protein